MDVEWMDRKMDELMDGWVDGWVKNMERFR